MSKQGIQPAPEELEAAVDAILEGSGAQHVKAEKVGITVRQLIGILKDQDLHRVVVLAQNDWDSPGDFHSLADVVKMHYDAQSDDIGAVEDGFCTGHEDHCVPAIVLYPKDDSVY